ncbi:MAG: hypothetical protein U0031_15770 [Thermomicrobiales bacterium]
MASGSPAPTPSGAAQRLAAVTLTVRGRQILIQFRVAGPLLVHGAPDQPLFLLAVEGSDPARGKRNGWPASFWSLPWPMGRGLTPPWPAADLLAWAWQRWELEVAHRELKTTFGLGELQAWSPVAAVLTVQWAAWVYAILVLAGVRLGAGTGTGVRPRTVVGAAVLPLVARPVVARAAPGARAGNGFLTGFVLEPGTTGAKWPTGWGSNQCRPHGQPHPTPCCAGLLCREGLCG